MNWHNCSLSGVDVSFETPPKVFFFFFLQEVVGSIYRSGKPKSLILVVMAFPLGAQDYGYSTTTGSPVPG